MRVYPLEKKIPPFPHLLFIYLFFVVVANWLSVIASSAWMLPPLRKIKGGQNEEVVGVWVVVVVGGLHM